MIKKSAVCFDSKLACYKICMTPFPWPIFQWRIVTKDSSLKSKLLVKPVLHQVDRFCLHRSRVYSRKAHYRKFINNKISCVSINIKFIFCYFRTKIHIQFPLHKYMYMDRHFPIIYFWFELCIYNLSIRAVYHRALSR